MTGIPFQGKEMALRKLEHLTDEYAQINPFKKVPVIDDDGFILTERFAFVFGGNSFVSMISFSRSVAIFMYLCDKYKKHDWYPIELKGRARVNEYAHWQHMNLRAMGSMLFRTKVRREKIFQ